MKNYNYFILIMGLGCIILSCKKEQSTAKTAQPSYSLISITNAAAKTDSFKFYVDDSLVPLPVSLLFGSTEFFPVENSENTNKTPYKYILSGYREIGFRKSGGNVYQVFFNQYFEAGSRYSIFLADTITHGQLKYIVLKDNTGLPDSTKSQIRFINLSPDAPAMDIWVFPDAGNDGYKLFTNRSYAVLDYSVLLESQTFKTINAGPYYFVATAAGTSDIIMEGGLILPGRSVITVYAKGLVSTSGTDQLDVGVIEYIQ
ncbi:MAG TPA: DUF4397 domain-containing protein [Puia sp.]|nr:DUF4397 domain-containing protein [Puia sp.]